MSVTESKSCEIWELLRQNNFIDDNGIVNKTVLNERKLYTLNLGDEYTKYMSDITKILEGKFALNEKESENNIKYTDKSNFFKNLDRCMDVFNFEKKMLAKQFGSKDVSNSFNSRYDMSRNFSDTLFRKIMDLFLEKIKTSKDITLISKLQNSYRFLHTKFTLEDKRAFYIDQRLKLMDGNLV
jgi:hypothetical protein